MSSDLSIQQIANLLLQHQVGIFPCDTIWGLIGILDAEVLKKVATLKKRPVTKPFVVLIPDVTYLSQCIQPISDAYQQLIKELWPGPYSLIFKKTDTIPGWVTAQKDTICIRIPKFEPLNQLLEIVQQPILSTSVNIASEKQMQETEDCNPDIARQVDFFYKDASPLLKKASTILDCTGPTPRLVRDGGHCKRFGAD